MPSTLNTICYQELVTPHVEQLCVNYERVFAWQFKTVEALGNARVAQISPDTRIGIRAPMSPTEQETTRLYILVDDLAQAVQDVKGQDANIMLERMEIPGQGIIAIYELGGIEHGLWQQI